MMKVHFAIPVKYRLFFLLLIGIIISIAIVTWFSIYNFKKGLNSTTRENLILETNTIVKMLSRESVLKREKVKTNIKVAHELLYNQNFEISEKPFTCVITNQFTKNKCNVVLKKWYWNGNELFNNNKYIDKAFGLFGGTITVFQKCDSGFVRISTNVLNNDSLRAVKTFIPNNSPVAITINNGKPYMGRAFVVNNWYITAYEPIFHQNKVVGMLYVGDKEKDLEVFRKILNNIHIGKTGHVFVFNENGEIIINPLADIYYLKSQGLIDKIIKIKNGFIEFDDLKSNLKKYAAFNYFEDFKFFVVATISPQTETSYVINNTIFSSLIIALVIILILSVAVYYITTESVHKFLKEIDISNKKLIKTTVALKESENRFQSLFNSTNDPIFLTDKDLNIVEVNQQATDILLYTREELLNMKTTDFKPDYSKANILNYRDRILKTGKLTYESEHLTKDGGIIPVEMNCKLIKYNNQEFILSVSRDISERKKIERKILSAVIQAEEKERERLSKDLHDVLGPLLSTIKIYLNELESGEIDKKEKDEMHKYSIELVDEAISTTRMISNNLMPRVMSDFGLVKAIESFCKKINRGSNFTINFDAVNYTAVDQTIELIIYRVVNELVNNTIKHASAQKVDILLELKENNLILNYKDNGIGFNFNSMLNNPKSGMGLQNIISRVKSVEGIINVNTEKKGFSISIKIRTDL